MCFQGFFIDMKNHLKHVKLAKIKFELYMVGYFRIRRIKTETRKIYNLQK
jgi:hypothetical protein